MLNVMIKYQGVSQNSAKNHLFCWL